LGRAETDPAQRDPKGRRGGSRTYQRKESLHGGTQLPACKQIAHARFAALHALLGGMHGAEVILQDDFLSRVGQLELAQIADVGR